MLPNIFLYTDYKKYLRDYYASQKRLSKNFSYRFFAAKSKVSAGQLNDVIAGRRALTEKVMRKYAAAMGLNPKETGYFSLLLRFVNNRDPEGKQDDFSEIAKARKRSRLRPLDQEQYEFYSKWYHCAIRELITLPDFQDDPEWIASRIIPRITSTQAKASLELLAHLELIRRDARGKWVQCDAIITSESDVKSLAMRAYNGEMLRLARESIDRFPLETREVSTLTLGVSPACYQDLKRRIREFKLELLNAVIEDSSPSRMICQMNFQLFPLAEDPEKERS